MTDAATKPRRRFIRPILMSLAFIVLLMGGGGSWVWCELNAKPSAPFDAAKAPPAPDYTQPAAWLAFPAATASNARPRPA